MTTKSLVSLLFSKLLPLLNLHLVIEINWIGWLQIETILRDLHLGNYILWRAAC